MIVNKFKAKGRIEAYKQVKVWIESPYDIPLEFKLDKAIKELEEVLK